MSVPADATPGALGRVMVFAQAASGPGYASTGVDATTGAYSLTGLTPGSYRLTFSPGSSWNGATSVQDNLVREYYDDATSYQSATPVDVSAADASGIDASLAVGRSISGTITIPTDMPRDALRAVSVSANGFDGGSSFGSGQVDPATGAYTMSGLAPGRYRVNFSVGSYWNGTTSVRPNLVGEYWNDAPTYAAATPVDVTTADASGIDAGLVSGRMISGTVSLPAGTPSSALGSIGVSANPQSGSGNGGYASVDPQTGTYSIAGLAPGSYIVQFRVNQSSQTPNLVDEYWNDSTTLQGATPVDTTAGDRSGIDATLAAGTTISGTVTIPSDAPSAWLKGVSVAALGPDGNVQGHSGQVDPTTGAYTITAIAPGSYTVLFNASDYWDGSTSVATDLASEYYDDASTKSAARPVSTASGSATGIDAHLDHGASLVGTVDLSALQSRADQGYGVTLVNATTGEKLRDWGDGLAYAGSSTSLSFTHLSPGSYRIGISTDDYDTAAGRPVLKSFQYLDAGNGTSVFTVTAGQARTGLLLTAKAPTASLSGTLTVASAPDGAVRLYSLFSEGWAPTDTGFQLAAPGSLAYRVDVPPGTYTVGFATITGGASVRSEWWNHRGSLGSADRILLTAGGTATAVDGTVGGPSPLQAVTFSFSTGCDTAETLRLSLVNPNSRSVVARFEVRDGTGTVIWRGDRTLQASATVEARSTFGREDTTYTATVSYTESTSATFSAAGVGTATVNCVTPDGKPTVAGIAMFVNAYASKLSASERRKIDAVVAALTAHRDPQWLEFLRRNPNIRKLWEAWMRTAGAR